MIRGNNINKFVRGLSSAVEIMAKKFVIDGSQCRRGIWIEIAVRKRQFSYATKTHHQGTLGLVFNLTTPHLPY